MQIDRNEFLSLCATDQAAERVATIEFKAKESEKEGVLMTIEGYASTNDLDSYNDIVEPSAFATTMTEFMEFPILLFGHDWYSKPIGKIAEWTIDKRGLNVKAEISDTVDGRDVATLIKAGVLKAFSIGFRILKSETDEEEESPIRTITKLRLYEISVVNVPANAGALFETAKSLSLELKSLTAPKPIEPEPIHKRSHKMADKTIVEMTKGFEDKIDSLSGEVSTLTDLVDGQNTIIKSIQDKGSDARKGLITSAELLEYTEKAGADISDVMNQIKIIKNARKVTDARMPIQTFKSRLASHGVSFVFNDQGQPLTGIHQKANLLFYTPVDNSTDEGRRVQNIQRLHDICYVADTYYGYVNHGRHNPTNLKSFKALYDAVAEYDPEFAKAMYSTGTGVGDEWVPTQFSAQLWEAYKLEANVEALFDHWQMPSNPAEWPIKTGKSTLYRASEASVNNPTELLKSNMSTGKTTFNAETYAVAVPVSKEFIEDSIISVVPVVTADIASTAAEGFDSLILNGDNSGTHMDSDASFAWATNTSRPEHYEDGLRYMALNSTATQAFDTQSVSAGVGDGTAAFAWQDVRYGRKLLPAKFGHKAPDLAYIMPLTVFLQMLNFAPVTEVGTYGLGGGFNTGDLPTWDGSDVIVSAEFPITLGTDGTGATPADDTGFLVVNKTGFKVGERRGMTLEFETNIRTQQHTFVGTMRKSFQAMTGQLTAPVTYGFKLNA